MKSEEELRAKQQFFLNERQTPNPLYPSIIFFSIEKSGSRFIASILKKLTQEIGISYLDITPYTWELRLGKDPHILEKLNQSLSPKGHYYACVRDPMYWENFSIENYKKLLVLRDPRDVLTSSYFSMAFSHRIPEKNKIYRKEFLKLKLQALTKLIDDYVLEVMPRPLEIYQYYIRSMIGKPNVIFLKYEDMISNFDLWVDSLIVGLEIDVSLQLINQIKNEANFTVEQENIYSHKRQVQPGDHKRKLKPKTIEILNHNFAEILETLGYDLD